MKIVKIHAEAFGKLNNVDIDLRDGINVVQNVNGFGKTTLASFIRAMLYGFTYKTVGGVKDSARYAPWDGAARFGGSMTVAHGGELYRIERFFGATPRQETLSLTNERTGKPVNLQVEPGEFFLGLTADSYDRSAYFPQEAVELSSNDNFDSRLANLIQNGADDYDKIQDKLRAYKKTYRYERGNGGKIFELENEQRSLQRKLMESQTAERRAKEIENALSQLEADKQSLLNRQAEYRRKQMQLQRKAAQTEPSAEEQRAASRLNELNETLVRIPAEFDKDVEACDALSRQIESAKPQQQRLIANGYNKLLLYLAIALSVIGIVFLALGFAGVLGNVAYKVSGPCIGAGIVGIVTHFILKLYLKRHSTKADTGRDDLINQYIKTVRKYVYTEDLDYESAKRRLWEAYKKYGEDVRERDALQNLVKKPSADAQNVSDELADTNEALSDIDKQLNALSVRYGQLTAERKSLVFDSVTVQDQLLTVEAERNRACFEYEVADVVMRLLEQAKDNLSSSYLPKLAARCSELLCAITQSNYSVVVDRNFNVKIREKGQTRAMHEFSRGIREITLLCFRVALSELLYDGAIPFVIIDDAFVNFDEDNFARATALLKTLSTNAQIIYFTCHSRTGELLK